MKILTNDIYLKNITKIAELSYDWPQLANKKLLITGATGMIGSCLIDVIMLKNQRDSLNCTILAIGRNKEKAIKRFPEYFGNKNFVFLKRNINNHIDIEDPTIDFIIHAASNTHPRAYANDPIGTITTNVIATNSLLELAVNKKCQRFVFLSSVEVYGENKGDIEEFSEDYCGYIDCNTLRAGYPESKRVGESLCQAFIRQKQLDIVVCRLSRVYGPTMLKSDSKALSQFILKALDNQDIVLKSEGNQFYSYTYVADAVSGILKILFSGRIGEAYNVANTQSNIKLKDLAELIANNVGRKVIFELPDAIEKAGFSTATKAILNPDKLINLGWKPLFSIQEGISDTINILKDNYQKK
ncbi:MAG: NAD-dependent epimerase/dehydratase family protein [Erysipelotrichaceae bacterium]